MPGCVKGWGVKGEEEARKKNSNRAKGKDREGERETWRVAMRREEAETQPVMHASHPARPSSSRTCSNTVSIVGHSRCTPVAMPQYTALHTRVCRQVAPCWLGQKQAGRSTCVGS
eukprot:3058377-Rhodomonas_salina.2